MARKFRFPSSAAIELATQSWHDWLDSRDRARKELCWKESFSEQEWTAWAKGLDKELVWSLAISSLDKLGLPRLWVKYWIACLVSPYDSGNAATYWKIRCPHWVQPKFNQLLTVEPAEELYGRPKGKTMIIENRAPAGPIAGSDEQRVWPPVGIEIDSREPESSVTIGIPMFLVPGLLRDPSPLLEFLKEETISRHGKHPLSQLLQRVGPPLRFEPAIELIAATEQHKLRALHKALCMTEYDYELVESLDGRQLKKVVSAAGENRGDVMLLGYHAEKQIPQAERRKIKDRVRKRVDNWFKAAGRWPLSK